MLFSVGETLKQPSATTFNPCLPTGNRYRHTLGHVLVYCPDHPGAQSHGYVPEHRLVMERLLGRYLLPKERVRHRNGDKADNRPDNLELVAPQSMADRFWGKVQKADGCWLWTGRRHRQGYGIFWIGRHMWLAHRLCYQMCAGAIPEGGCVCHRCDNPPCVNPAHLFVGTQQENMQDMARKRRRRRLSPTQADAVREMRQAGESLRAVATRFGVSPKTIMKEIQTGRARGERQGHAKLSEEDVRSIRLLRRQGVCTRVLAERFGVRRGTIQRIVAGKAWKHIPVQIEGDFSETIDAVFSWADIQAAMSDDVEPLFGG